ncbi:hypothetical protein HK102_012709 [Quaeritorhiza haematococci]|nr:hypothetical protein HK102_012709 [Quaeritorhiza haematococci]
MNPPTSGLPPITGRFRKRIARDLFLAMGTGVALANAWWRMFHVRKLRDVDEYTRKVQEDIAMEAAWMQQGSADSAA